MAGGVLEQPDTDAGAQALAVVVPSDPVTLGGEQLHCGPHGLECGVKVVVGRPIVHAWLTASRG
jgi:hypothetical protein